MAEQGHITTVEAGKNVDVTFRRDYVVHDYEPVAAWEARAGAERKLQCRLVSLAEAAHPRSMTLVVVDAASGRPLQAVKLGC